MTHPHSDTQDAGKSLHGLMQTAERAIVDEPCPHRIRLGGNCCWDGFADKDCNPATRWVEDDDEEDV